MFGVMLLVSNFAFAKLGSGATTEISKVVRKTNVRTRDSLVLRVGRCAHPYDLWKFARSICSWAIWEILLPFSWSMNTLELCHVSKVQALSCLSVGARRAGFEQTLKLSSSHNRSCSICEVFPFIPLPNFWLSGSSVPSAFQLFSIKPSVLAGSHTCDN